MSSFIKWSPQVRDLVGDEVLRTLCRTTKDYNCMRCERDGRAARERTHVIVVCPPGMPYFIQFAHGRCAPSQVIRLPQSAMTGEGDPNYSEQVITTQFLWPTSEGFLPGLIIDRPPGLTVVRANGDVDDLWTQLLLRVGWDLLVSLDQPCRHVNTSAVELSDDGGTGRVVFDDPDHSDSRLVLVDRLPALLPEWRQAAADTGCIRILAGTIGTASADHRVTEADVIAAVQQGSVVGALVPVAAR
ncbi:hypothetical protein BTO20_37650 (plasmid) [Mycobacterium dioxanotrophicus]|jgi:hypothetical protein|uniref:Uncharacterized protein n=1 Tax=Mycobacterium dioxanotrophicus TaxID=482462 RepID=A0A1Y0CH64_9MYCO|nr:hypothetical protein [Mycobacterium dioxanotrophicus]ART74347.1 hypothetical protein BTO20_37650 [Mycobacterium dioxanotrophicus]